MIASLPALRVRAPEGVAASEELQELLNRAKRKEESE